jgi:hypothetical protein
VSAARPRRGLLSGRGAVAAVALLCAGCGSAAPAGSAAPPPISPPPAAPAAAGALSLAGSQASSSAAWAVLPMGAPSGPNEFWQLLRLAPGAAGWALATPPDVATNGALALGLSGTSLTAGVRPSLYLAFSPVTRTADGGQHWSAGPAAAGLAGVPDALAVAPDGSELLGLDRSGQVATATPGGTGWAAVTSARSLAGTAAGRACGLTRLTAVAYSPAAVPLAAGDCGRPGIAGIFARDGATWRAAGPPLPAALAGPRVRVLRLAATAGRTTALLQAGTELIGAWLGPQGQWAVSPPLAAGAGVAGAGVAGAGVATTGLGASGALAVTLPGRRGEILSGPGGSWRPVPPLPAGRTVIIALPAGGGPVALAATGGTLTAWAIGAGTGWTRVQTLKVPIQYGSSL